MPERLQFHVGLACLLLIAVTSGCSQNDSYPNRPITLVCPWAAGGGTDRVSRQMAIFLENELDVPVNVINATGGQGVTGHARGMLARPDGYTLSMMTLELNMLHWRGLTDLDWQDCEPLMSVNEDPAALFVRTDSPFTSMGELEAAVRENPGALKASGTASLGAWHLALAGWLLSFDRQPTDVVWIPSQGSAPSLQELMSGGIDLVCCSVPEARSLLDSNRIRCLGVMADKRLSLPGLEKYPTLKEQGSNWTLTGWRGLGVPKGTPPGIRERLVTALRRIVTGEAEVDGRTFPAYMEGEGFDYTWRQTDDFAAFLKRGDEAFGSLLGRDEFQTVQSGPVGPNAFPLLAGCLGIGCLSVIGVGAARRSKAAPLADLSSGQSATEQTQSPPLTAFVCVILAAGAYSFAADSIGFIPVAASLLFGISLLLKAPLRTAVVLAVVASPVIYQLFTGLLRVPLPPGLLGW
ncbi:MAG: tripartite tricarboxylate transporter substrate-binding protein [Planctomycetota bacterium]|jgi:tripartite-type tricarboxylate transporter receptor subunit TctC